MIALGLGADMAAVCAYSCFTLPSGNATQVIKDFTS